MPTWQFLQKKDGSEDEELVRRYAAQTISDIYRTMQSRLDGYRQSAAAVFIGIVAATFSIDSALLRFTVDPNFYAQLSTSAGFKIALVVASMGVLPTGLAYFGAVIIKRLGQYFAEMTSIIYKIDLQNEVFVSGRWIPQLTLYPNTFLAEPGKSVARNQADRGLEGWTDPSILRFRILTWFLFWSHAALYGAIGVLCVIWNRF